MEDPDIIWSGGPWIGPAIVLRTIALVVVAVLATVSLDMLGLFSGSVFGLQYYLIVYGLFTLVWLIAMAGLVARRASQKYTLRSSSIEVERGIARRKTLVVSPTGFAELELDQGVVGRLLNYGSLTVRSQGGQQLSLELIRNPRDVSARIRDIMSVPTVRVSTR